MTRQYKRDYSLTFQSTATTLTVTNHRISFNVAWDLRGYPNIAQVLIYNLSSESRNKIQNELDKMVLNAGYEGNVKTVFEGAIRNITHARDGQDIITTIYAADGERDFQGAFSSFTLKEGATLGDILKRVVSDFTDSTLGPTQDVDLGVTKLQGYSVAKPSRKIMDELAVQYGFDWTMEQGNIKLINKKSVEDKEFVIGESTGMLGYPSITEIGADVTFLLNPEVLPGRSIYIESPFADVSLGNLEFRNRSTVRTEGTGRYKVLKATHVGDTHGDTWSTTVVGEIMR